MVFFSSMMCNADPMPFHICVRKVDEVAHCPLEAMAMGCDRLSYRCRDGCRRTRVRAYVVVLFHFAGRVGRSDWKSWDTYINIANRDTATHFDWFDGFPGKRLT